MAKRFYHATSEKFLELILEEGFKPTAGDCGFGIYFFDKLQEAKDLAWRHHDAVIVEIVSDRLMNCLDLLGGYPKDWYRKDRPYYKSIWVFPTEDEEFRWTPEIVAIYERIVGVPTKWIRHASTTKKGSKRT